MPRGAVPLGPAADDDQPSIGERVRYWRKRRGKSQHVLAGLAGVSQPYLSQIETGDRPVERRSTLVALANALQVSVPELTGKVGDPTNPARASVTAYVPAIRDALIMREAGERTPEMGDDVEPALAARGRWDFGSAAPMLPGLLGSATGADLVQVASVAAGVLRYVGYEDLARDATRLGVRAAQETDDPAWMGTADLNYVWSLPVETRVKPVLATRAADSLQPHIGEPRARRAYGMLHLQAALSSAVGKAPGDAHDHLQEADEVARSLGEPEDWDDLAQSCFGPTNVGIFRLAILLELGETGRAIEDAASVVPERIPLVFKQVFFHLDVMALLAGAGRDSDAVGAFLKAEAVCPQFVRLRPTARDTVEVILRRTRRHAITKPLRRAAEAVGLHDLLN